LKNPNIIRDALRALPNLAVASTGNRPTVQSIFFPESHAEALDPDVSLVIGNRGMGKSFWALALSDQALLSEIAVRYSATHGLRLDDLDVHFGFSDAEGTVGVISAQELELLSSKVPTEYIWRSVVIKVIAPLVRVRIPKGFKELVDWVRTHPEEQLAIFKSVDAKLSTSSRRVLILFDQLDQLAAEWGRIQELTKGLMKVALAMKSYRNIKMKIFMRPDQAENKQIFRFPDASKILGGAKRLTWRVIDLYGLLFFELSRDPVRRKEIMTICAEIGISTARTKLLYDVPRDIIENQECQALLFHEVAGELMGSDKKRGRPYTWIPTHLADARGEISPRTFLKVMKVAAEENVQQVTPIDFHGIQEGVRRASEDRLLQLEEDYPWVSEALKPLKGLLVPCELVEISARWGVDNTVRHIITTYSGSSAPIDLVIAKTFGEKEESATLAKLLGEIGVFEQRSNGKINVPDIFRVDAGIRRKGGVTPQQRKRL
jgi:hypothetical protein